MDEHNTNQRPNNPRRKRRSQFQVIKEDYLPTIIIAIGLILITWFIIGSIVRAVQNKNYKNELAYREELAAQQEQQRINQTITELLAEAAELAKHYDYNGAIAVLDRFDGDMYAYEELSTKYTEYANLAASLVLWDDPSKIVNLPSSRLWPTLSAALQTKHTEAPTTVTTSQ